MPRTLHAWLVTLCIAVTCCAAVPQLSSAQAREASPEEQADLSGPSPFILPRERRVSHFETVVTFFGPMPTGVTISQENRIFVTFPRWSEPVPFTVAEIRRGQAVPFPDADVNEFDVARPSETFISVQSVVIDPRNRLWILDTGRINFGPLVPGGAKLIGVDLGTHRIFTSIPFPSDVVLPTTYLNDMRFDLRRGANGVAFITDSSDTGPNAIIVVDLATGRSRRRLHDHPSTKAEPGFLPWVEGRELRVRQPGEPPQFISTGADGIALSHDGDRLFYCPLASRRLFSVSTAALVDDTVTDAQVGDTVEDVGQKPAADGLESDAEGYLYSTAYEHNAIVRRSPDGMYETLLYDPRVIWPDTLALAGDGYLYVINNQFNRQPRFHEGQDVRHRPYSLLRIRVDATPVRLQ